MHKIALDALAGPLAALHTAREYPEFVHAVFRLLAAATPGCFATAMVRHVHAEGTLWMCSDERPGPVAVEGLYRDHPGQALLARRPRIDLLPTAGVLPAEEELVRSGFYAQSMQPFGWRHAVGLCFWEASPDHGLDCIFTMHRTAAQGDFLTAEVALLRALRPPIDQARRRVHAWCAERSTLNTLEELIRGLPLAALVLDWELRPAFYTAAALAAISRWQTGEDVRQMKRSRHGFHAPADLTAVCEEMKTEWDTARFRCPRAGQAIARKVVHPRRTNWHVVVSLKPPRHPAALGKPGFLLQFTMPSTGCGACVFSPRSLPALARLTPEERTIAEHICNGRSNDEIASLLSKSIWTVKRQVYSIFRKLPVSSRTRLTALLLGQ